MKKLILCASLVAAGLMTSCEKELLVPEDSKPVWLGASIYEELRNGKHLSGTFNNYLRLVDDLGYAEVLSRTGSKTIFPANDEAFERFFRNCPYKKANGEPVRAYGDLTEGMKKQLLYSSMLDNAMLAGMLSNVKQDDNNVTRGVAIKHETNISVTDSVTLITDGMQMPQNNTYWNSYRNRGVNVVYDATKPMMVHFTREQMLKNNITTTGVDSDFGILRGEPVGTAIANSDTAYIFQTKIINQDVTCTNGYVHQVGDVLIPPGNIAQVMRGEENTQLFSRILDYFCAPYYDPTTTANYNAWALQNGRPTIDSIFQVRYFSKLSQGGKSNVTDPTGTLIDETKRLEWDLGWNQFNPSTIAANALADMGAILAPTDDAIKEYFLPGGGGAYFVDLYGTRENTEENLPYNLDDLHNNGNGILTRFVNNLIQGSFIASVPSKFGTLTNESSGDFMGLSASDIQVTDGKYDVVVANNGVIYKMKSMIAPDEFQSVIGPAITYPDMSVMNYFSSDKTEGDKSSTFGADMFYYLMAMKANYLYFIPSDPAMAGCYIDPVSLGSANPRALEFYSHVELMPGTEERTQTLYGVKIHNYNPETGEVDPAIRETVPNIVRSTGGSDYASQVYDLLNYNTVVLDAGEEVVNNFYLTKHGGAIYLKDFKEENGTYSGYVYGGAQLDNNATPAKIETGWKEKNGWAFRLDNIIQPSLTSVNKLLNNHIDRFDKFLDMCAILEYEDLLSWAGISAVPTIQDAEETAPQFKYLVFSERNRKALDMNVNFFNGYNYTFYAPDNAAMDIAYAKGLPTLEEMESVYLKYVSAEEGEYPEDEIVAAKAVVLSKINALRAFVRYHFQNNSVFADNLVEPITYQSLYSSDLGIPVNISVQSTGGVLTVQDEAGQTLTFNANDTQKLVNKMTRDYEFDADRESASSIAVSSFAVVHQTSTPLCYSKSKRYDDAWRTEAAVQATARNYGQLVKLANNFNE